MFHRFFIEQDLAPGAIVTLEGEEGHHAVRVSRVRPGEKIELIETRGVAALAEVTEVGRESLEARVLETLPDRESPLRLTLAMALIKPDLFELVLRKGTELGVSRFVPLETDHVEKKALRGGSRRERWERIVREAVKQSGRSRVPEIEEATALGVLLEEEAQLFVMDADGESVEPETVSSVTLCVGPEGGWSDRELKMIAESGRPRISLGPRRLRAETAALAGSVWAQLNFGDFDRRG